MTENNDITLLEKAHQALAEAKENRISITARSQNIIDLLSKKA